jgi:hypothetical protein
MRSARLATIPLVFLLTGCIDALKPASERTGFVSASTVQTGAGPDYALKFIGAFYHFDGLQLGIEPPETCEVYVYTVTQPPVGQFPTVDAGPRLYTSVSGREDTLYKSTSLGIPTYQLAPILGKIPFTPGDTLTLDIPGALGGMPPATLQVRTAEPFDHDPIGTATEGDPVTVTWTAATEPGSQMLFFLRFSSISVSDEPNVELRCAFDDDGSGTIQPPYSSAWSTAPEGSRSAVVQRVRYTRLDLDAKTSVTLISSFDRPITNVAP